MWGQPRATLRAIVYSNPKYGVIYLAALYALDNFFFFSNWWSIGLTESYYLIFLASLLLSPLAGLIWLYLMGWIFYFTGRWLKGEAPAAHLRCALAWSKIPMSASVFMWLILLAVHPEVTFILNGGGSSSLFIHFITIILSAWSYLLLLQSIREVQRFSLIRAFANTLIAGALASLLSFLAFNLIRYIYF